MELNALASARGASDLEWLPRGLALFGLVAARLLPIALLSPLFGGSFAPRRLRIGLGLVLAIALAPLFARADTPAPDALDWIALAGKEALVGTTLALALRLLFELPAAAGALIEGARGATLANLLEPSVRPQPDRLSAFFVLLFLGLFFGAGGASLLLDAFVRGYELYPPFDPLPSGVVGEASTTALITFSFDLLVVAVRIALPVIAALLIVDVAFGLVSRVAPRLDTFFAGMGVRATVGLFVLALSVGFGATTFVEFAFARLAP